MEKDDISFEFLKKQVKKQYDQLKKIYCPYFEGDVFFSAPGFKHLLYKGSRKLKERDLNSKKARLKLFDLAVEILRKTTTVQELSFKKSRSGIKMNKKSKFVTKTIYYWSFLAILKNKRLKIIVKQIGNGKKEFWSVFPFRGKKRLSNGRVIVFNHKVDA